MAGYNIEDFDRTQYIALTWSLTGIAILFTLLRLWVRIRSMGALYLEDYFIIAATIFIIGVALCAHLVREPIYQIVDFAAATGQGKRPAITLAQLSLNRSYNSKVQIAFINFFWMCLWSVKASFMTFYRRLFVGTAGYMRWWWVVAGWCIITFLASFLSGWMDCMPLWRRWSVDPSHSCSPESGIKGVYAASSFDIFSDLLVIVLPMRLVWTVQIPVRQKIALVGLFCLGFLVIIFAAVRLSKTVIAIDGRSPTAEVIIVLWSLLECFVAVVVGNLPMLKNLISKKRNAPYYDDSPGYEYAGSSKGKSQVGNRSKITGHSTHIKLDDLPGTRGSFGSEEQLHIRRNPGCIIRTHEVFVSREDGSVDQGPNTSAESSSEGTMRKHESALDA